MHKGESEEDIQRRHFIDKIRYSLFILTMLLLFLILWYMKRRLKQFDLFLERIEKGDYDPGEIPEGFDVKDITEMQPEVKKRAASMIDNPLDYFKTDGRYSSGKMQNRSLEFPLETECRNVLETEQPSASEAIPERKISSEDCRGPH